MTGNGASKMVAKVFFFIICAHHFFDTNFGLFFFFCFCYSPGKSGLVVEIRGWDNISCRSVANVSWISGSTNVYRLGHKGNVDLKYVQPASGGFYYRDHMPILGKKEEQQPVVATSNKSTFTVGDRVKVCLDRNGLIKLQQGHGGNHAESMKLTSVIITIKCFLFRMESTNGRLFKQSRMCSSNH